jgi:vancomycin resistance protein YoaR
MLPEAPPSPTRLAPPASRRRGLRWAGAALGVLAVLWLGLYVAAGSGIPRGTTVHGVAIGGLSEARASDALRRGLADDARAGMPVVVDGERLTVDPVSAGLTVDVADTVARAGSRSWNPITLVRGLFGAHDIDPSVAVDQAKLRTALAALAAKIDGKPVEGDVRFEAAQAVPVAPRRGRTIDRSDAGQKIRDAFLHDSSPVELATTVVQPKVGQLEVDRAVREFGDPAMSGPVDLVVSSKTLSLSPDEFAPYLSMAPDAAGRLQPALDGVGLKKAVLDAQLGPLEVASKDATFRIVNGRPVVVPAKPGRVVDLATLQAALLPALTQTGDARRAEVALVVGVPKLTTAAAQALGVTELVSTFTTHYPSDFPPRLVNIHRAADLMNRTLVLPGQIFSMNKAVGERTKERGFAAGFIINGGKLEVDFGGGVSQLATTTFNAAFFAGLDDVEHHPHSFYISRYPVGREATVAWGVKDLRFRNDSGHGVFVTTGYTNSSVTVRIWGTKIYTIKATRSARYNVHPFKIQYDKRPAGTTPGSCVHQDGVEGFAIDVKRLFYQGGAQVRSESFHTRYDPEARIVCGQSGPVKPKPPTPTPTPTTAPPD